MQLAKAALDQARLNLEYTTIKAPLSGIVSRKTVETGQVVQPGQPLMARRTPAGVRVTGANRGRMSVSGTMAAAARSGSRSAVSRSIARSSVKSPVRVRRRRARCAPTPSRSPRSCASDRT